MKTVTLILTGSIAAYKSLELIRLLRQAGVVVQPVLTAGAKQFVTPLAVASLAEHAVYDDLFSLKDETEMGHIRLSRTADVVMVAPASADFLAKMAMGMADDLASSLVLASSAPVWVAPAMNVRMWEHPATQRNIMQLKEDGVQVYMPEPGALACAEVGTGRMVEPDTLAKAVLRGCAADAGSSDAATPTENMP